MVSKSYLKGQLSVWKKLKKSAEEWGGWTELSIEALEEEIKRLESKLAK